MLVFLTTYGLKCAVFVCMGDEWRIRICPVVYGPLTYLLVDWFMVEWPVFVFSNEQVLLWLDCLKLWFIELCFKFLELVYIFGCFLINSALWIDIVEWCRHGIIQTFLANALGFLKKEEQRLLQLGLRVSTNNLVKGDCQQSLQIDQLQNMLKPVLWMQPFWIRCASTLLHLRM